MRFYLTQLLLVPIWLVFWIAPANAVASRAVSLQTDPSALIVGGCAVFSQAQTEGAARQLGVLCDKQLKQLASRLEIAPPGRAEVELVLVSKPSQIEHFSAGRQVPKWAQAVAFLDMGRMVLALRDHNGAPVKELETTLVHELVHLVYGEASGGASVPRWFSEGVAIWFSEGPATLRKERLWWVSMNNDMPRLNAISHYPEGSAQAAAAYAQAADFVGYLVGRGGGDQVLVQLAGMLKAGNPFSAAFNMAMGMPIKVAEEGWREEAFGGGQWLWHLVGDGLWLGGGAVLTLIAFFVARRRKRRRLAEMAKEEAPIEQMIDHLQDGPELQ